LHNCGLCGDLWDTAEDVLRAAKPTVDVPSATIQFDAGPQTASFELAEPEGVILLYRVSAPAGVKLRSFARLPSITVPLLISTNRVGPNTGCRTSSGRVVCITGEEWCPMPPGVWEFRIVKTAGQAGNVTLTFNVGQPPKQAT
jgi:hypothetical protein